MKAPKESEVPYKETREGQSKLRPKGSSPILMFTDCRSRNLLDTRKNLF
jgi:hypothetical protein